MKRNSPGGKPLATPLSWQDTIDAYVLAEKAVGRPMTTIRTRLNHIRRFARSIDCAPADVTGAMLVGWFGRQDQWQSETRRGYRGSMLSFFGWAHDDGRIATDPSRSLRVVPAKRGKATPAPDRVWNESLLAADRRETLMLYLACEAGFRRGEVALAHTRDLFESFDGWVITAHGKGDRDRTIPISDELAAMIEKGAAGHTPGCSPTGWLFPGDIGGHLSPEHVGKLCARLMPGVWTMHKLRHRYATKALRGTGNIRAVQELLGHASVATTEIYTEVGDGERRAAANAASNFRSRHTDTTAA